MSDEMRHELDLFLDCARGRFMLLGMTRAHSMRTVLQAREGDENADILLHYTARWMREAFVGAELPLCFACDRPFHSPVEPGAFVCFRPMAIATDSLFVAAALCEKCAEGNILMTAFGVWKRLYPETSKVDMHDQAGHA